MDVVLELFDTFLFDPVYAKLLPASSGYAYGFHPPPNSTFSMREAPTPFFNGFQYEPSTFMFSLQPSESAYMSRWPRDFWGRQALSLFAISWLFGIVIYFLCAGLSYLYIFDHETFKHPKFLKNQVRMEIRQSLEAFPGIAVCTVPFFLAEVRGYSKMYDRTEDGPGLWYNFLQFPLFLVFTDFLIYWIHRGLHHPSIYKHLHKKHHKWIMPTPFASHAFHPLDGFSQSLPYHMFPFIFPLQKFAYVALFVFINVWTVMIHDGEYIANSPIINGAACHTLHHLAFHVNYGQYTTLWDRLGGSYRMPGKELFQKETKMSETEWKKQAAEMEEIVKEVEGDDDRTYGAEDFKKTN